MKRIYPATYSAHIYNPIEQREEDVCGVLFCNSFTDAAAQLEHCYGDELISINIFLLEENSVLELPREIIDQIQHLA